MAYEGKKSNKEYVCIEGIKLQLPCQSGTEKIETLPIRESFYWGFVGSHPV